MLSCSRKQEPGKVFYGSDIVMYCRLISQILNSMMQMQNASGKFASGGANYCKWSELGVRDGPSVVCFGVSAASGCASVEIHMRRTAQVDLAAFA